MKNIIWIASYPKSGNTWFRVFLSNLMQEADKPVSINELERTPIAGARQLFDDAVGYEAADLSREEIERLRPEVYEYLSHEADDIRFLKIHDACTYIDDCPDKPLISFQATRGGIYILRNPLDVAISFASHSDIPIDDAIRKMNDDTFCFENRKDRIRLQLRQRLRSWSFHVRSWVEAPGFDIHVMRYEDMKQDPINIFSRAITFCGLDKTLDQVKQALAFSDFNVLQQQENEGGFREKPAKCNAFFRKGKIGDWRNVLTQKQVQSIIGRHRDVMEQYGYLDRNGNPVY